MRATTLIGRRVADRFTITRFLGEGGMATVFVAQQDRLPHEVALKIMNEELTADRSFVKRFQREAKAAARVQHPNSVAFIDYGVADGLSYIAMELLEGEDLYVLLEREGAIGQARAGRIVIEVCDALVVAHDLGIVHRDLKPENIMVVPDPSAPNGERVKVLDFGIAKLLAPDTQPANHRIDPGSGVTRAGTFIGTPAYMSPEQCGLLTVDTRADLYTCGVLLFQMVTGRLPFEGQTPLHTATLHIHEPPPRPSSYAPKIDVRMEAVILKALSKSPDDRYQTASELASTLRTLVRELSDARVSLVGKAEPGSIRGRTRNSAASSMALAPPSDPSIASAKTILASDADGALSAAPRTSGPTSDPITDPVPRPRSLSGPKTPPRPAAGAPAAGATRGARPPSSPEIEPDVDADDQLRTLVRAPDEDGTVRFGPQNTKVIVSAAVDELEEEALATPRPAGTGSRPPPPPRVELPKPPSVAPGPPGAPPRPLPPRPIPKPTLKSAAEFHPTTGGAVPAPVSLGKPPAAPGGAPAVNFKLGSSGAKLGVPSLGSRPLSASAPSAEDAIAAPAASAHPESLGAMRLGAGKLGLTTDVSAIAASGPAVPASPSPPAPVAAVAAIAEPAMMPPASISSVNALRMSAQVVQMAEPGGVQIVVRDPAPVPRPPSSSLPSQVVVTPMGFGETTRMDVRDPSLQVVPPAHPPGLGNAATVPMISPALVASVVARGAPPGVELRPPPSFGDPSANVIPPSAAPRGPPNRATTPMLHGAPIAPPSFGSASAPAPLPPTPPVFPLEAPRSVGSNISGVRGLLVGFLAGAVVMILVAVVWVLFLR